MRRLAISDVLAGLAVAGLILPEGVAYAGIAGLPPGRALAAGIAGGLAYLAVGRSRFAVLSPTSSSAAILAAALATLPGGPAERTGLASALVVAVGVIFIGLAAFRLGSLSGFVSRPVLRGFAFGLAVTIIVKQLPKLFGVTVSGGPIWSIVGGLLATREGWRIESLALGMLALGLLLALRRVPRVPGALVVLAGGIALAFAVDLPAHGVALAGPVVLAMPGFAFPIDFATWARLMQLAAPIALIVFAESWGTMRGLALRHGDTVSPNRELAAIGVANVAAALAQGMPVGAGFSAGSANESAGAASRLAALTAALALLLLGLFAGPLIARIPDPVLAAVVIGALTHALSPAPIVTLFRIERDQWIALAAAFGVLGLGVLNGMLAAIALSIAQLLYRLSHPSISVLGQVAETRDYVDVAAHPDARPLAGVVIFRPNAPLIFANAEAVLRQIGSQARAGSARTVVLSLEESDDLDSTAAEVIGEFCAALGKSGRYVILARVHDRVRQVLAAAGQGALAGAATFSVADAVASADQSSVSPAAGDI
ncbi:SulP family inorganic anion transporter [Novosphingobium sp.]|uniref:SulP family inorganic anion transporter n=1 Tax=Novosphingobium sp. TaxID=1874826 RepID=UPI0025ECBDD7|nr:SulP family inorganic anion transporter [Novosphingobium sp.]